MDRLGLKKIYIIGIQNNMKSKGFTLIEMMVTVLIFSIVVGAVIGVFVSALQIQRYNLTYQQLLDQTSYAMEYMGRAIRMAVKDDGVGCISSGLNYQGDTSRIKFVNYKGECQEFLLENNQLKVRFDSGGKIPLTSDDFNVTSLSFGISGESDADNLQPRVTIFMGIQGTDSKVQPKIAIQTAISQRNLDF